MDRKAWKLSGLTLALILAVAGVVQTQQHQQHHPGGTQTSQGQMPEASQEAPAPMMQQMQGMMENMQEMMQQMQGMMGRRGGMMAEEDEEDEDGMAGGMMGHGHMMLRKLDRLAEQLNLTQEQQIRIRSIVRNHLKEAIQARADMAVQRVDLIALLDAESMDLPKVKETLQALASQRAGLVFAHIAVMDEINKLLTPEQQQQFRTMRRQMMHGGGMMGRGGMHGQGGMMGHGAGSQ
jgi:Spy/CpxP family protein refolding chaperone